MKKAIGFLLSLILTASCVGCQKEKQNVAKNSNHIQEVTESTTEKENSLQEMKKHTANEKNVDYSQEFGKIKGCCVFFDIAKNNYNFYNKADCTMRYSPNSILR